jgi:hypothetical protein
MHKTDRFSRQQPHFVVDTTSSETFSCDRKGKRLPTTDNHHGALHPIIVKYLTETEPDLHEIHLYNEVILRDGSYVRAFPNYRGDGPWYDFANIQWEENATSYLLPAQCLTFFKRNNECMAVIQSVEQQSCGKVTPYSNSILSTHYYMQCNRSGTPALYTVNCASIDSTVLGIYHDPSLNVLEFSRRRSVMIIRPRNEWAYGWYVWNQHLRIKNTNRTRTKPFVDLGSGNMVSKVRELIDEAIVMHGKT